MAESTQPNPNDDHEHEPEPRRIGLFSWFAHNKVAANLVMLFLIVAGLLSLSQMKIEFFPELDINWIVVAVPHPGATPEDVEESICQRVEEAVKEVDNVKKITAIASEGMGTVFVEFERYVDMDKARDDVKQAVDRITTFPEEAEEPQVTQFSNRTQVLQLALYGDVPRRALKELAESVRDDLTTGQASRMAREMNSGWEQFVAAVRPPGGISTVNVTGLPPYEIGIEVSERALRKYNLTFDQVAQAVRQSSLDLPAGNIKSEGGEILVRTRGQRYRGDQYEDVVVITRPDGTNVRVGDVATVIDGFEDTDDAVRFNGKPAVILDVFRVGRQDTLEISRTCWRYVESMRGQLPAGVDITLFNDQSVLLKDRINLLLRNGGIGLLLVFLILACFLDLRLALWTMMGIPMSFLGAFVLLPYFDVSINMISLFAFIVVLGIVVDDAIVVGESIFDYRQRKKLSGIEAAIRGVGEMALPVTMAIATTIAAFFPLLQGEGTWFQILRLIPIVVISVLLISLIEAFIVLPAHLSGGRIGGHGGPIARFQGMIRRGLGYTIERLYTPVLRAAVRWRYATLAIGVAVLMITGAFVKGGHIRQEFFPQIEADNIVAALTMPQGMRAEQTMKILDRMEDAARQVERDFTESRDPNAPRLFQHMITTVGSHPTIGQMEQRGGGTASTRSGGHLGEINIALLESEKRNVSSTILANRWRERVGEVPGATALKFSGQFMASDAIDIELAHRDRAVLERAADELEQHLRGYAGVADISDNLTEGKRQIEVVGLTPLGRAVGLRREDVARQLRAAFYGNESQRIQRGRDEVKVMVRYPLAERSSLDQIDRMRMRLPDGTEASFKDVAVLEYGRDYAVIYRTDRMRSVAVIADTDEAIASTDQINQQLRAGYLPELADRHPGLTWSMEGEEKEKNDAMSSLKSNFVVALLAIYALLAAQFRSYIQPIIIMTAIPFGLVGAVMGHLMMALVNGAFGGPVEPLPLSFMSFFGIVALTGVVVNDSLIMIDLINRRRREGASVAQVIEESGTRRFRPILLTTLTTFFGLMPMILEQSLQAKFLIPMAVSLGFGVLFATGITLLLVPSLYMIVWDLRRTVLGHHKASRTHGASTQTAGP